MQIVARKLEGHWARTEDLLTWTWNCHCGQSLFASLFYFLSPFISVFLSFLIVISFVSFCHLAVVLFCLFIYFLSVMAIISPVFCLLQYRTDRLKENAKLPCIVCKKWVGDNSTGAQAARNGFMIDAEVWREICIMQGLSLFKCCIGTAGTLLFVATAGASQYWYWGIAWKCSFLAVWWGSAQCVNIVLQAVSSY